MALNMKYVPEVFKSSSMRGSKYVTRNAKVQLAEKAIEEHNRLASGGNISAFNVQANGPKPAKKKTAIVIFSVLVWSIWGQFVPSGLENCHFLTISEYFRIL